MTRVTGRIAGTTSQLFLSYACGNRNRALTIADALEPVGLSVWIDRRGIPDCADWAEQIANDAIAILRSYEPDASCAECTNQVIGHERRG
jgi:hypothetical protein